MKIFKTYLLIILAVVICSKLPAQDLQLEGIKGLLDKKELLAYDSNYIQKYGSNVLSIAPLISAPIFITRFAPQKTGEENKANLYRPYLRNYLGVTVNYRAITFSAKIKGFISPEAQNLYGKTNYTLLRLRLYTNAFIFDFFHNKFNGLSDRNTDAYDPNRPENEPFIKRPDISTQYNKLKILYIFSHKKFSYRAAFRFTERQKKSKASLYISSHSFRLYSKGDSSFFNIGQRDAYGSMQALSSLKIYSFGVGPGVTSTLVKNKWFISFRAEVLGSMQHHTARNTASQMLSKGWRGGLMGDVAVSFGYNGDRFYATFISSVDHNITPLPHISSTTFFFNNELSVGMRFNAPKFVRYIYDNTPLKYFKSH